jgi:hypothetical protein
MLFELAGSKCIYQSGLPGSVYLTTTKMGTCTSAPRDESNLSDEVSGLRKELAELRRVVENAAENLPVAVGIPPPDEPDTSASSDEDPGEEPPLPTGDVIPVYHGGKFHRDVAAPLDVDTWGAIRNEAAVVHSQPTHIQTRLKKVYGWGAYHDVPNKDTFAIWARVNKHTDTHPEIPERYVKIEEGTRPDYLEGTYSIVSADCAFPVTVSATGGPVLTNIRCVPHTRKDDVITMAEEKMGLPSGYLKCSRPRGWVYGPQIIEVSTAHRNMADVAEK